MKYINTSITTLIRDDSVRVKKVAKCPANIYLFKVNNRKNRKRCQKDPDPKFDRTSQLGCDLPTRERMSYPSLIPPVVVDGSNPQRWWLGVSPGIVWYSFTDLGRMNGWVSLAARGDKEICWYHLHGESILDFFFLLQNDLHNERKSKIKYIQQCPNWYFVTKKANVKTIVNKITKQSNLKWKVWLEMKSTIKVKLK